MQVNIALGGGCDVCRVKTLGASDMSKIEDDGTNIILIMQNLPYMLLSLFIYPLLIISYYHTEIFTSDHYIGDRVPAP